MTLISINKKICFSEGPDIDNFTRNVNIDFATVKENLSTFNKRNTFFDSVGECSIYPGINSSFGNNDILNSNFYKIDSFRNDLYEVSKVLLYIKESDGLQETQLQDNSELIITDYLNNTIRFIFKTTSNVFDGSTDDFGNVIIGIQNLSGNEYLQRINLAIKNYLKINEGLNFSINIDNYNNQLLLFKQKKPGVLGSVNIVAPEGIVIASNMSSKFSNENYETKMEYIPYKEDVVINKSIKDNPKIFKKTLGINNLDYEEEIYFDDSLTKFNNDFYFESPDRIKWNFTFNSKAINSLSTTISPIETISILEGNITTEQSLLGIKGDLVCSGKDARNRANIPVSKERLMPDSNYLFNTKHSSKYEYELEPFNDEGYDDLVAIRSLPYSVNYEFQKIENNGRFVNKLVVLEDNQTRNLTILSNDILIYNEDKMDLLPFYERDRVNLNYLKSDGEVFLDNEILYFKHYSHGRDVNSEHSILPESIAYYGEIE